VGGNLLWQSGKSKVAPPTCQLAPANSNYNVVTLVLWDPKYGTFTVRAEFIKIAQFVGLKLVPEVHRSHLEGKCSNAAKLRPRRNQEHHLLGRNTCRWEDNIRIDLKEIV
jgi:hypothetical protein